MGRSHQGVFALQPGELELDGGGEVGVGVLEAGPAAGDDVVVVARQLQRPVGPHRQRQGTLLSFLRVQRVYEQYMIVMGAVIEAQKAAITTGELISESTKYINCSQYITLLSLLESTIF